MTSNSDIAASDGPSEPPRGPRRRVSPSASLEYTASLRRDLPQLLAKYRVGLMLDAGCGWFSWMAHTDLVDVHYIGMDVAADVIEVNRRDHAGRHRRFVLGDMTRDSLPPADLMLCRDCASLMSYSEFYELLTNFLRSDIPYILLTTYGLWHNRDAETGRWRQLNMMRPPFSLPPPLESLEDWQTGHPIRHLALWSREQIRETLTMAEHDFGGAPRAPAEPLAPRRLVEFPVTSPISAADIAAQQLDLVTVVYQPEVALLRLQARSLAKNLDPQGINKIHVIINEAEPRRVFDTIMDFADVEYGPLRDRVQIWTSSELSNQDSSRGWRTQQTLKLLIANHVLSPKYVALDAKNHLIRKAGIGTFLAPDGRGRSFWTIQNGSLGNYLANSVRYFNLDEAILSRKVMPATTPYVLYTNAVRSMMSSIAEVEGISFEEFFHARGRDVTEFFLYFSYLLRQKEDLEKIYRFGPRLAVTLFTRWPDTAEQQATALARLNEPSVIVFGLHKNRVGALDEASRAQVHKVWVEAGLFPDLAAASDFYKKLEADVRGS